MTHTPRMFLKGANNSLHNWVMQFSTFDSTLSLSLSLSRWQPFVAFLHSFSLSLSLLRLPFFFAFFARKDDQKGSTASLVHLLSPREESICFAIGYLNFISCKCWHHCVLSSIIIVYFIQDAMGTSEKCERSEKDGTRGGRCVQCIACVDSSSFHRK